MAASSTVVPGVGPDENAAAPDPPDAAAPPKFHKLDAPEQTKFDRMALIGAQSRD